MDKEFGLLRQITLWLWSRNRRAASSLSGDFSYFHTLISGIYPEFNEIELERLFSESPSQFADSEGRGKCLFLEPDHAHNIIPILSFRYNFERSIPELRFRIALFTLDENDKPKAFGYRFESPEGEGIHHYYHAQLITTFNNIPLPCPKWLPTRQPAFALDANSSPTLIVCLLISLYGLDFIRELRKADFWNFLQPYVEDKMMCFSSKFQPKYWQMRIQGNMAYFKTWKERSNFRLIMRNVFGASNMEEISREVYYAQDEVARKVH